MVPNDYSDKKFLIVDDFESFQKILKRMLHALNSQDIETALNGVQAIHQCQEHRFDVIFCDFDLGKGINGLQVLEELRRNDLLKSSTVFIMITAESSRDAVVGSMEYKPDAYLNKPITPGELESRLVKCLKQKTALEPIYHSMDRKDFAKAIELCDKEMQGNTRHKNWCLKTKGNLLSRLGKWQDAQDLYQDVLDQRPLFWAQLGSAQALEALKQTDAALEGYKQCIKENPSCLEAYEGVSKIMMAKGDTTGAQRMLEQSSKISARSVTRQKLLTKVCKINHDFEGAAKASRSVVKLAEFGMHKSSDNELELADNLTEAAIQTDDKKKAKAFAKEALDKLQETQKKYTDQDIKIQSKLIESRAYSSIDKTKEAQASLIDAENRLKESAGGNVKNQMELVKSYFQNGEKEKALSVLEELAETYKDDPEISAQLDQLTDEPVSANGKRTVVRINKNGIEMFEKGDYQQAAQYFIKATQHFPKHMGIRLNAIQALLFDIKANGPTANKVTQCNQNLIAVPDLPDNHPQFKRYNSFKQSINKLQTLLKDKSPR
jgi:CheY-like chemotaxis protein